MRMTNHDPFGSVGEETVLWRGTMHFVYFYSLVD